MLGFPTHFFQKTKLGSIISSTFSSSFHSYLLQDRMNKTQKNATCSRKFYCALKNKIFFSWASKTNYQWVFLLKTNKLCLIN